MPRPRPEPKLEARPTIDLREREVVGIYVGRKLAATLHFTAKTSAGLDEVVEAVGRLWKESCDA